MCGLAGALSFDGRPVRHESVKAMTDALQHRGPDEGAVRLLGPDAAAGRAHAGLGHRRLKVVDLTSAAAQPMRDADDRGCLVYNGELYNAAEIRRDLWRRGVTFRSRSDTEVVLMALLTYGVEPALERFNGMFALALYETGPRRLTLARDRFGEKPLYYSDLPGRLLFASEVEALLQAGGVPLDVDPEAIELYLTFGWIPAPWSIYRAVRKLPHGALLRVEPGSRPVVRRYYRLEERLAAPPAGDPARETRARLEESVRRRRDSDVPLGAFLSGGIDSAAVASLLARTLDGAPRTFSVGVPGEPYFDEAPRARRLAAEIAARHTEIAVDGDRLRDAIPAALAAFGEPFADSSAVPCYVVAAAARRVLTVALSGDGGDEVFGGYRLYRALAATDALGGLALPGRRALRALLCRLPARHGGGLPGTVHRLRRLLEGIGPDLPAAHAAWMSTLSPAERRAIRPGTPDAGLGRALVEERYARFGRGLDRVMAVEVDLPLPDDMLAKVDRTSMRHGLEVRVPFLDPALVELSLSLPAAAHFTARSSKRLLRQALRGVVPDRVLDAPKRGFEVPMGDWIAGPLAPTWRDVVTKGALLDAAGLDVRVALAWFEEHRLRRAERGKALWALFALCEWQRTRPRAIADPDAADAPGLRTEGPLRGATLP